MMHIGDLVLATRRECALTPEVVDGCLRLTAETTWVLKGPAGVLSDVFEALPGVAERIDDHVLFLDFGNSVGWFEAPGLGRFEVRSGKWRAQHFNRMLRELSDIASELPFEAAGNSALPYDRCVPIDRQLLYHAFVYIRYALDELEGDGNLMNAYKMVLDDPHNRLQREEQMVKPELACSLGPRAVEEMVSGRLVLHRAPLDCVNPLTTALRGHLPEAVREDVARRFVDTAENRFAKALLDQICWIVDQIGHICENKAEAFAVQVKSDCGRLRELLRSVSRHSFWKAIGPMNTIPEASTVLQRRRGYRELFGHFAALRLAARVPISDHDARRLLEAKDIALMYEMWAFFQVVGTISAIEGPPTRADAVSYTEFAASVRHGYQLSWQSGVKAAYNPSFSRRQERRRSFSVSLRPDISVRVPNGACKGLHLLDAKFKVNNLRDLLGDNLDEDPEPLRAGSFKRGDLYKMHTYRDAILDARSVWILYPGHDYHFFNAAATDFQPHEDEPIPTSIDGVGAIPLRPEENGATFLESVIKALLGRGERKLPAH